MDVVHFIFKSDFYDGSVKKIIKTNTYNIFFAVYFLYYVNLPRKKLNIEEDIFATVNHIQVVGSQHNFAYRIRICTHNDDWIRKKNNNKTKRFRRYKKNVEID